MNDEDFLRQFELRTLPADEFDHAGHLRLGWLYVRDNNLNIAASKLNAGIEGFAESLGATGKFHCTLTTTFACIISNRFEQEESFHDFMARNPDLLHDAMSIVGTHYSKQLLATNAARETLVRPDRAPFPKEFEAQLGLL